MTRTAWVSVLAGLALGAAGCSDSSGPAEYKQYGFREEVTGDVVRIRVTNDPAWSQASELWESQQAVWAIGRPVRGDGGFNTGYSWHLDPATISFAEVTIEACQTAASAVADDLDYWIGFGQVCVWGVVHTRE